MNDLDTQTQDQVIEQDPAQNTADAGAAPSGQEPAAPAEPAAAPAEPPQPAKAPPPKWAIDEITSERARRREAEREAQEYKAMLDRLQRQGQQPPAGDSPAGQQPQPDARRQEPDPRTYEADVRAAAARMRLGEDTVDVRRKGEAEFPNFGETLRILNVMNFTADDVVADLIAVDKANAHKLLDKIAKDPERAGELAKMDPRTRVAEFTRMSMAEQQQQPPAKAPVAPKPVSSAPPPKPAFDPAGSPGDPTDLMDDDNKLSDAEWRRRYKAKRGF